MRCADSTTLLSDCLLTARACGIVPTSRNSSLSGLAQKIRWRCHSRPADFYVSPAGLSVFFLPSFPAGHRGGAIRPARGHAPNAAQTRPRPTPAALLELHTLQALDATLAGASLRDVAEGLFGVDAAAGWYSDGGLRSKVRRLVRRGDALMRGGYRRLAQLSPLEKGRFEGNAKRP